MKVFDANFARKIAETSTYDAIIRAIEKAASGGFRTLKLFHFYIDDGYVKKFGYNEADLEKLKTQGFIVTEVIESHRKYIFWGEIKKYPTGVHTVTW